MVKQKRMLEIKQCQCNIHQRTTSQLQLLEYTVCCFIIHVPGHTLFRSSIVLEPMLCFLLEVKEIANLLS